MIDTFSYLFGLACGLAFAFAMIVTQILLNMKYAKEKKGDALKDLSAQENKK